MPSKSSSYGKDYYSSPYICLLRGFTHIFSLMDSPLVSKTAAGFRVSQLWTKEVCGETQRGSRTTTLALGLQFSTELQSKVDHGGSIRNPFEGRDE